jgi:hypothetical protein
VMLDRPGIQGAGCINEPFSLSWMYVHGRTWSNGWPSDPSFAATWKLSLENWQNEKIRDPEIKVCVWVASMSVSSKIDV